MSAPFLVRSPRVLLGRASRRPTTLLASAAAGGARLSARWPSLSTLTPSIYGKVTEACEEHARICTLLEDGVNEHGRPLNHTDYARLSKQILGLDARQCCRSGCVECSA